MIPYLFLVLAISGIVAGAATLVVSKFKATTTDAATLGAMNNVSLGLSTAAEQFPTVAIIAIMSIVIGVLATTFVYLNYFR